MDGLTDTILGDRAAIREAVAGDRGSRRVEDLGPQLPLAASALTIRRWPSEGIGVVSTVPGVSTASSDTQPSSRQDTRAMVIFFLGR